MDNSHRQDDYRNSDYRNRGQMSSDQERRERYDNADRSRFDRDDNKDDRNFFSRSVDEVRSWFGDEEAERRRNADERMNSRDDLRSSRDWDSSRGYGSDINSDYDRDRQHSDRTAKHQHHGSHRGPYRYSNDYGGSRNTDFYRDYPTHRSGRSNSNLEDDEMRHGYDRSNDDEKARLFGGRDYERNYPTRAERNEGHSHDLSEGWQSTDSYRGYRSLNNTGRTGISQDNQLGREREGRPKYRDQDYSHGDYRVNLNAGGQEFNSRHYYDRDRPGTRINEYAQQGYSQGYGRTAYSADEPSGEYINPEVNTTRAPKNYKGNDERIYVEACEALGKEMDASSIEVTCSGNEITLTGNVKTKEEKRLAERIVDRIQGVEDIHNRLTVGIADSDSSSSQKTVNGSGRTKN